SRRRQTDESDYDNTHGDDQSGHATTDWNLTDIYTGMCVIGSLYLLHHWPPVTPLLQIYTSLNPMLLRKGGRKERYRNIGLPGSIQFTLCRRSPDHGASSSRWFSDFSSN